MEQPCDDFQADLTAAGYGICKCGHPNSAHKQQAYSPKLPRQQRARAPSRVSLLAKNFEAPQSTTPRSSNREVGDKDEASGGSGGSSPPLPGKPPSERIEPSTIVPSDIAKPGSSHSPKGDGESTNEKDGGEADNTGAVKPSLEACINVSDFEATPPKKKEATSSGGDTDAGVAAEAKKQELMELLNDWEISAADLGRVIEKHNLEYSELVEQNMHESRRGKELQEDIQDLQRMDQLRAEVQRHMEVCKTHTANCNTAYNLHASIKPLPSPTRPIERARESAKGRGPFGRRVLGREPEERSGSL